MEEHRNDANRPGDADEQDALEPRATGEVLGVSRPPVAPPADEFTRVGSDETDKADVEKEADERGRPHVGSRDVTEGTTGGTGPDTGGSGVFRRGSGATGTDLGNT